MVTTRLDPSAAAVLEVLHAAAVAGRPWLNCDAVAAATALSAGQARAALQQLVADGFAACGLLDDGERLSVCWRLTPPERASGRAAARAEVT
jgi:hypothetical protein